ncbi:uncharacterized protein LOC126678918 [Mercurialis annua]|uniref:uncharacterized protein LOC126678918 n=1 Tax=Mercurialis annua TaxID=3986 RepID=UPI00215FA2CE|nr:uncharacterized protein LOC126678918 [Mercurialis annua]
MSSSNSNNMGFGFITAFAVSGSVVFIARQVHKRLISNFMKEIELELMGQRRSSTCQEKKRVRFAEDVINHENENRSRKLLKMEDYVRNYNHGAKKMEAMPLNRQVLYKGIVEYRTLKGCNNLTSA